MDEAERMTRKVVGAIVLVLLVLLLLVVGWSWVLGLVAELAPG